MCVFYGFEAGRAAQLSREFGRICDDSDLAAWQTWYDRFATITPSKSDWAYSPDPITRIEYASGLPDLGRDELPAKDSPSLGWLLARYMIANARTELRGPGDRFNWTFEDGLNVLSRVETDEARAVFAMYRDRILFTPPMAGDLAYLNHGDIYTTYLSNPELKSILDADDAAGFMQSLATSLDGEGSGVRYARFLREWKAFLCQVLAAGDDLFYYELGS